MSPKKESTEHGLGQNIEDTIEDSLGIWSNDITALRYTPGDWVEKPEENSPDATYQVRTADIGTQDIGVLACCPGDCPGHP